MSRFNVRPISVATAPPPPVISGKLPSAFSRGSSKGSDVISHIGASVATSTEPVKKGRPSKDELRKHKMALASEAIAALCSDKPTRNKVRRYFEGRVLQLDEEKR
jgi:hypothetical protein